MSNPNTLFAPPLGIVSAGIFTEVLAAVLWNLGNPADTGICVAYLERDIAEWKRD